VTKIFNPKVNHKSNAFLKRLLCFGVLLFVNSSCFKFWQRWKYKDENCSK